MAVLSPGLSLTMRCLAGGRFQSPPACAAEGSLSGRLSAELRVANQGKRNANDSIRYLKVAEGVLAEVTRLLTRAAELAEQARADMIGDSLRASLGIEFQAILTAIHDAVAQTQFHGAPIFASPASGEGACAGSPAPNGRAVFGHGLSAATQALTTPGGAEASRLAVSKALASALSLRSSLGDSRQRLAAVANRLSIQVENLIAAHRQPQDAHFAKEVVNLTKFQILSQSGTGPLAQASQPTQRILELLR